MMRPRAACWFEAVAARADATRVLEALAATGAVELEAEPDCAPLAEWRELTPGLAEYAALAARYAQHWPAAAASGPCPQAPLDMLKDGLHALNRWVQQCEPLLAQLHTLAEREQARARWLSALQDWQPQADLVPAQLHGAGPVLACALLPDPALAEGGLLRSIPHADGRVSALWLAPRAQVEALWARPASAAGRALAAPDWLPAHWADLETAAEAVRVRLQTESAQLHAAIDAHSQTLGLAEVQANLLRLRWVCENVRGLSASDWLVRIRGWTSQPAALEAALDASQTRALVRFPRAPEIAPPLLYANPRWAQPFEVFARAFGVPGSLEADPTTVVALVAPLLFGYMFGDIGQGAVILLLGLWLRRHFPMARMAITGGAAAMAFGWLFGSVFTLEHWVAPLWLHPLDQPLTVLAVPLAAGTLLLLTGLTLNLLAAWWQRKLALWCRHDLPGVLGYLGALIWLLHPLGGYLLALALALAMLGPGLHERRASAAVAGLGLWLEHTLQLLINTLSFARVGAFALAHAGLSSAVVMLATGTAWWAQILILIAGNLLILTLEALVVSIQTTRLLLFEFFTRFLTGSGRPFLPLPLPPSARPAT